MAVRYENDTVIFSICIIKEETPCLPERVGNEKSGELSP